MFVFCLQIGNVSFSIFFHTRAVEVALELSLFSKASYSLFTLAEGEASRGEWARAVVKHESGLENAIKGNDIQQKV